MVDSPLCQLVQRRPLFLKNQYYLTLTVSGATTHSDRSLESPFLPWGTGCPSKNPVPRGPTEGVSGGFTRNLNWIMLGPRPGPYGTNETSYTESPFTRRALWVSDTSLGTEGPVGLLYLHETLQKLWEKNNQGLGDSVSFEEGLE